jgi:hypothetical protein
MSHVSMVKTDWIVRSHIPEVLWRWLDPEAFVIPNRSYTL